MQIHPEARQGPYPPPDLSTYLDLAAETRPAGGPGACYKSAS